LSPYELTRLAQYMPYSQFADMVIVIAVVSGIIITFEKVLALLFGTGKRAVNKMAAHLLAHEDFKPLGDIPQLKNDVHTLTAQIKNIITEQADMKDIALANLRTNLTRTFYEIMDADKFNVTMYGNFNDNYDLYIKCGGNGKISGFKAALQIRWETEIKNAARADGDV